MFFMKDFCVSNESSLEHNSQLAYVRTTVSGAYFDYKYISLLAEFYCDLKLIHIWQSVIDNNNIQELHYDSKQHSV